MSVVNFPLGVLTPADVAVTIEHKTRPGQQATNGMCRSVGYSAGQFRLRLDGIPIYGMDKIRAWRAFVANIEADRQLVRIRVPDLYGIDGPFALATRAAREAWPDGIPFATDQTFSHGLGFAVPTLETAFAQDAALGAREIYVSSPDIAAGCVISIAEFCYAASGVWSEADTHRVRLSPPLRKAAAAGDAIALAPVFVGTCASELPGYDPLRYGRFAHVSLEFVEDLTRLAEEVD